MIVDKVTLHTTITFCNLYIPSSTVLHLHDLAHIETQLLIICHLWLLGILILTITCGEGIQLTPRVRSWRHSWPEIISASLMMTPQLICIQQLVLYIYRSHHVLSITFHGFYMEGGGRSSWQWPFAYHLRKPLPSSRPPKCQFHKADWNLFKDLCLEAFLQDYLDGGFNLETFINKLWEIANQTIPKSNPNPKKPQKPWFSDECKKAILELKRSLKSL